MCAFGTGSNLKPANIVVVKRLGVLCFKIGDVGEATILDVDSMRLTEGVADPLYLSPEVSVCMWTCMREGSYTRHHCTCGTNMQHEQSGSGI